MSKTKILRTDELPPFKLDVAGANIRGTDLSHANLTGANFTGANCSHVNFYGANFKNARLTRTKLIGADLTRVKNLSQEQIDEAIIDHTTKLPEYLLAENEI